MAKVVGIGGVFVRARDHVALRAWYTDALGIEISGDDGAVFMPPVTGSGAVFSIMRADSTYLGDPSRQMAMVNLLVDDLDAVVDRLARAGVIAEPIEAGPYGRFSWVTDPESNRIELWEPPAVPRA